MLEIAVGQDLKITHGFLVRFRLQNQKRAAATRAASTTNPTTRPAMSPFLLEPLAVSDSEPEDVSPKLLGSPPVGTAPAVFDSPEVPLWLLTDVLEPETLLLPLVALALVLSLSLPLAVLLLLPLLFCPPFAVAVFVDVAVAVTIDVVVAVVPAPTSAPLRSPLQVSSSKSNQLTQNST
jgi:hypothetical protein